MTPRKPALGFIFVTLVLDILGIGLIVPIAPRLVEFFEAGDTSAAANTSGLLMALYALAQFLCAPVLGSLSDRFGRRPVILASVFGSGLDYFLLALAPNLGWFFVGRVIAGVTGANFSAATAYIADISPPEKRAANFGMIGAAFGLGFIVGPAMGGVLEHVGSRAVNAEFGLRLPFYVAGGLTLVNWLYGLFVLPESLPKENRRAFSWARSNPVGALLDLRRHPVVLGLAATFFLVSLAHQTFPATWVLYTEKRFAWNSIQTGLSLALVGLTAAAVQGGLTRSIIPRLGERKTVVIGLTITALILVAYGLAHQGWMLYALIVVGSLGGISTPAMQALISRCYGPDEQGGVQGSLAGLQSVAAFLGMQLSTRLFGYFIRPGAPAHVPGAAFFSSSVLVVIGLLLAIRSFRNESSKTKTPSSSIQAPEKLQEPSSKV